MCDCRPLTVYVCEDCAAARRNNPAFKLVIKVVSDDQCEWCNQKDEIDEEDYVGEYEEY